MNAAVSSYEDEPELERPRTRGDCLNVPRQCPWISCKYSLFLDVSPAGIIRFNFPGKEPHELRHSCALDLASLGGLKLHEVGSALDVTRERIRQIEVEALAKIRAPKKRRLELLR